MMISYWSKIKITLTFLAMAMMLASTVACSKKGNKTPTTVRHVRNDGYNTFNNGGQQYDPRTGQYVNSEWGAIYNFNTAELNNFMYGAANLGYVSSRMDDSTGIRFRTNPQNRTIDILVWDDVASQTGEAYYWTLTAQVQGNGVVLAQDDVGQIEFRGNVQNGVWTGQVIFYNSNPPQNVSSQGSLGTFSISASQMFR